MSIWRTFGWELQSAVRIMGSSTIFTVVVWLVLRACGASEYGFNFVHNVFVSIQICVSVLLLIGFVRHFSRGRKLVRLWISKDASQKVERTGPLSVAEFLVCVLLSDDRHKARLGDLEELYRTLWAPRFGRRWADVLYVVIAVRSVLGLRRAAAAFALSDIFRRVWRSI